MKQAHRDVRALQKIAPIICLSNLKRTEGKSHYNGDEGFPW